MHFGEGELSLTERQVLVDTARFVATMRRAVGIDLPDSSDRLLLESSATRLRNHSVRHSLPHFQLNDSFLPFCQGLSGSMKAVAIRRYAPTQDCGRHELRTIVRAQVPRHPWALTSGVRTKDDPSPGTATRHIDRKIRA